MQRFRKTAANPKVVLVGLIALAATLGVLFGLAKDGPIAFQHPEQRVSVAHAALADGPTMGCANCHENPVNVSCATCHTAPPTSVQGIKFPHHKADEDGPTCNECHTPSGAANGDVRFASVPAGIDHAYCQQCHALKHN